MAADGRAGVAEDLVSCPITTEPMVDAVFCTKSGRTYSEAAIKEAIRRQGVDPFTKVPITVDDLVPNYHVRQAAEEYLKAERAAAKAARGDPAATAVRCMIEESWANRDEVLHIESVERVEPSAAVRRRFDACRQRLGGDPVQLLHGTTRGSVSGIFTSGFQIPTSFARDGMAEGMLTFGKAVYFTKNSSKAAQYGDQETMIVASVLVGKLWKRDSSYETLVPHKVHGMGRHSIYADFNGAANNELACYDPAQVLPRWVVKYRTTGKDGSPLPREVPMRAGVDELVRFLRSSTRHREIAFRYIGDSFRDTQRPSIHRVATSCSNPFFTAVLIALRGANENLVLHALRVLWNMSFGDRRAQRMILDSIPVEAVTDRLASKNESIQYRAAGVLANLCHLEAGNHAKVLSRRPGRALLGCALTAYELGNTALTVATLTAMANILQSGVQLLTQAQFSPITRLLDAESGEVRDAATHVLCNAINNGKPDAEWQKEGYRPGTGIDKL